MKISIGTYPYLYPVPVVLVGTLTGDRPNYTTLGDIAIMGIRVPLICISLGDTSLACENVLKKMSFSINIPTTDLLAKVDFCGSKSGREFAKEKLFTTILSENEQLPFIQECPVNMECQVIHDFKVKNRHMFIAEVLQTYVSSDYIQCSDDKKKVANINKLDPIIYALDNKYYSIGSPIGTGYQEGKAIDAEALKRE